MFEGCSMGMNFLWFVFGQPWVELSGCLRTPGFRDREAPGQRGRKGGKCIWLQRVVEDITWAERLRGVTRESGYESWSDSLIQFPGSDPSEPRSPMVCFEFHITEPPSLRGRFGVQTCGDASCAPGHRPAAYLDLNCTSPGQVFIELRSRINTQKRCPLHYRGLECKSRKSRATWRNRQIWPWSTKQSKSKANRVLPTERNGHSKHPHPTTQEKTLHMDITRWEIRVIIFFAAKDGEALYSQ